MKTSSATTRFCFRLPDHQATSAGFPTWTCCSGKAGAERFRGKIVLVGATATGLGDSLPTPVSGWNQPMAGVEINANLIDALRRGIAIESVEARWRIALTLLLLLLPYLIYPRLKPRYVLMTSASLLLAYADPQCAVAARFPALVSAGLRAGRTASGLPVMESSATGAYRALL